MLAIDVEEAVQRSRKSVNPLEASVAGLHDASQQQPVGFHPSEHRPSELRIGMIVRSLSLP
jgi:hypothetical protein